MLIVMKFGGTSVGNAERIRGAAEIVAQEVRKGNQVVVVTSAMSGVTNELVGVVKQFSATDPQENRVPEYLKFTKQLEQKHLEAARRAIRDRKLVEDVASVLYTERHGLERVLIGSFMLGELTPIGHDFIVSEGERLVAPILAATVKDLGVDAVPLGGQGCGITTDNNYGNARPDPVRTREGVRDTLLPILKAGQVPVVAGFYGTSQQGRVAILGRGGSDYSATLIAASLDAAEVWIMKDVDGIQTTDPRLVPAARTIPEMPFEIAAEMAMLGAKVLHQQSVGPCIKQGIPIRTASSFEPHKPGTRLVPLVGGQPARAAVLTLVRGGGMVRLTPPDMGAGRHLATRLFQDLDRHNVDVLATAGALNGESLLCLVGNLDWDRFLPLAKAQLDGEVEIEVKHPVAVLGVVGEGVGTAAGILAQTANCLQAAGVHPLGVLQGASPHSIVVALPDNTDQLSAALKRLHTELGLDAAAASPSDRNRP
jgi:aspartate kinase